ncbi:MAG: ergothioneine biosynthesis protein EgtB [Myxococcota bacterium]
MARSRSIAAIESVDGDEVAAAAGPRPDPDGYRAVRAFTERLRAPLDPEDCVAQSMPDASPVKWHLAHTTWFFETFVLAPYASDPRPFHPRFAYLFNSYYEGAGARHARPERGVLTRPSLAEVMAYRADVDTRVLALLDEETTPERSAAIRRVVEIGLHHEQQHQELILTDVKHLFSRNALLPAYRSPLPESLGSAEPMGWLDLPEGVHVVGRPETGADFAFDNERPVHRVFLEPARIADRLVTNGEYRAFIDDGGYRRPELWLELGWRTLQREGWGAPLYWRGGPGDWSEFTLAGERALCDAEPVAHVSFLEADAFARWAGARLPSEAEWEVACGSRAVAGNFVESGRLHPAPAAPDASGAARQLFGDLWEWTGSSYGPYPGYRPEPGTLGEYNGKFMCEQIVLRGGSCASPRSHLRASYRNFFHAPDRWQLAGIRLAKEPS